MSLITKSSPMFTDDKHLFEHLHEFSKYVGGRRIAMKNTLKSGKLRVDVDVKDEQMLDAMPGAAKTWLGSSYKRKLELKDLQNERGRYRSDPGSRKVSQVMEGPTVGAFDPNFLSLQLSKILDQVCTSTVPQELLNVERKANPPYARH
ncbi:hypothetical protein R1sor_023647 [Riccia sorocarpa]|uniref:Uncharacterized protein n=1 Tax=Riccia sorocarpa TaxID=122646 RepID=A0ABD3GPS1_9MARC